MEMQFQLFCEGALTPPDIYVEKCKKVANSLFRLIQGRSRYKADRCRLVGGLGKKTSTFIKADADLVVFVNEDPGDILKTKKFKADADPVVFVNEDPGDILKTKKFILADWFDILLMDTDLTEASIRQSPHSLQFIFDGVEVDLLPAINFSSDVSEQKERVMKFIKKSENPMKTASNTSAELTEVALEFLMGKSKFCHDLARLAKFWSQTILFSGYISGKSSMMEMIGVRAGLDEEKRHPNDPSYCKAFEAFLEMIKEMANGKLVLIFDDYYDTKDIPKTVSSQRPLLLDPTNPYNNFLSTTGSKEKEDILAQFLKIFGECAENSLTMLSYKPFEVGQFFMPQPMMWRSPVVKYFVLGGYFLGTYDYHDVMPQIKIRINVDPSVRHNLEMTLYAYAGGLRNIEAQHPDLPILSLRDCFQNLVNKMDNEEGRKWIVMPETRHEDRQVTLMMPFMHGGRHRGKAVFLSFNIYLV